MLRRYASPKASRGTVIPESIRLAVLRRDDYRCVPKVLGLPHDCSPGLELDHVRASGALGKKSPTTIDNLVTTCPAGHRAKTLNGRAWRPPLIEWIRTRPATVDGCSHVDHVNGCPHCESRSRRRADPLTLPEASR